MNNNKGTTLVEVMVASIIFAVAMVGGLTFFSMGKKPLSGADETNFALQLAEDDMEQVKIQGGYGPDGAVNYTAPPQYQYSNSNVAFNLSHTVTVLPGALSGCEQVVTLVTWNSPSAGGAQKSVSLVTIVSYKFPGPPWQS